MLLGSLPCALTLVRRSNVLSALVIDRLGRRRTLAWSLAAGAGAAFLFALVPASNGGASLAVACAFNGLTVGAWNALDTFTARARAGGAALPRGVGKGSTAAWGGAGAGRPYPPTPPPRHGRRTVRAPDRPPPPRPRRGRLSCCPRPCAPLGWG